MKSIKYLVLLFAIVFLFPIIAFAEGEEEVLLLKNKIIEL